MNRPQDRGRCAARHQAHDCKKRDPPPLPSKRVPLKPGHIPSAPDPNQPTKKTARNRQRAARRKNRRQNTRHNRQLRILQQNIAGFKSRRVELLKRLSDLKVDVAAIQEANFSVKTVNGKETHVIPEIRGWNVVAQERKTGRKTGSNSAGRGGVAWLIREGINYDILKTPPTIQNDNTTEWVGIRVYQEKNNHVVNFKDLYNLYVPPIHESSKDDNRKQNFKTTKLPVTENTLFFGDVNCHGTWDDRIGANDMAEMWEDWLTNNDFSYMNTPFSHTRKDSNGRKSSPDISIIHNKLLDKYSWTPQERNPGGSDHLPILITLTLEQNNKRRSRKCKGQTRWAHKKAHWDLFKYFVEIDLKSWFTEDEKPSALKDMSARLNCSIINAAKKSIPRGNRPNIKPFWNEAIDEATKESNEARANCHLSDAHAQAYKLARDNLTKVTAEAREESWQKFVTELDPKTDPGKVWKTIAAMDGCKPKTRSGTSIKMGDKTATTDQQKAKLFNQSYHLESRISKDKKADKPTIKAHRAAVKVCSYCSGQRTGMCCPFTKEELKTAMTRLKSGKSPGEDKITNNMLVRLPPIGKEALLYLYNKSWETKTCPKEWKSAVIVTLPKPGKDPSLTTSYRPISLLSTISKLMERLVQQRLQDFLERGKKLYPGQAGFRKGRSTTEQIQRLVQMISDNNQNRLKTTVVYVQHSQDNKELKKLIHDLEPDIKRLCGEIRIIFATRKHPSIGNRIVKNRQLGQPKTDLNTKTSQKCFSRGCKTCPVLYDFDTKITVNGLELQLDRSTTCKDQHVIYVAQCQLCNKEEGQEDTYFGQTLTPFHTRLNGHRHKFKIDESRTYEHSALSMHCYIEHRDNFNFDIFKFGIVKKVQPSLLDREESRFCTKFKTNVWGLNRMEIKR